MKKKIVALTILSCLLCTNNIYAKTDKEIIFRNIPWGTSFTEAEKLYEEGEIWSYSGEWCVNPSVDAVLYNDDYKGIDFEYNDINILGTPYPTEIEVAGYTTTDVELHFSYAIVNGIMPKTEEASAFYGATYVFEPINLEEMGKDLLSKLSSIYGDPDEEINDKDWCDTKYTYYHWYGGNNTELALTLEKIDESMADILYDKVSISYAWRKGDELLQAANDYLAQEDINVEASSYGSSDVSGL